MIRELINVANKLPLTTCRIIKDLFLVACLFVVPIASNAEDIDIYKSQVCSVAGQSNYRFIFVVDNSISMRDLAFMESKLTIDASIQHVLATLDNVEVAVVQYGTQRIRAVTDEVTGEIISEQSVTHTYDITVPFTNDSALAVDWDRKFGRFSGDFSEDHTPASLAEMRLDNIYAPGGALDITDAENVQFVFFTDAERDLGGCCSSLVANNRTYLEPKVYEGFGEYDALKNGSVLPGGLKAQFTVLSGNFWDPDAIAASAAIASVGGSFTGAVEANATDPDGSGTGPRRFVSGNLNAANDIDKIVNLLDEVIIEIKVPAISTSEVFAQASIDVDRPSFSSDNRAFFSLFVPSETRGWRGNLKGYFIGNAGLIDTTGAEATISTDTGVDFKDTAQSFWSASPDGNNVLAGGANEQIENASSRNLYTHLDGDALGGLLQQRLESSNTAITASHLNVGTETQRVETLDWLRTAPMGDSLHASPVSVLYQDRTVLYAATNQGVLHAIDATQPVTNGVTVGGDELWGYVPKELLGNLPLLAGAATAGKHIYGIDGAITRWHNDENQDGIVNGNDTILLIFGQRRGGRSYYALDVTNPTAPRFQWQITGGVTTGFDDLMQTWSRPALITVSHSGQAATTFTKEDTQRVLVFAGGYDAATFDGSNAASHSGGGAIYMVDRDGTLLWKTETSMRYSMPADITAIDSNGDSKADRLYAADLGGQIWRVDLADLSNVSNTETNLFASVANQGFQPFFYQPSVSYLRSSEGDVFAITIGSGNRTEPLATSTQNYMYMFKDQNIKVGPPPNGSGQTLRASDLYDSTDFKLGSTDATVREDAQAALKEADGWMIELSPGEKVLADVLVVEGVLLATTYKPIYEGDPTACETEISSENRLYSVSVKAGSPVRDSTGDFSKSDTELVASDRAAVLLGDGILSTPVPVFPEDGNSIQILIGKEVEMEISPRLHVVFWHAK